MKKAPPLVLLVLLVASTGCSPSLSPLYRDYQVEADSLTTEDVLPKLRAALTEAGWSVTASAAENVVATERVTLNDWGLYRVEVYLEAAPLAGGFVRVLVHPQRRFITGGRSKIQYMIPSLRRAILPDLNEALEKQGLVMAKSARERGLTQEL